mmetsp:Transcript_3934/g.10311  ORF Transcript_3934/g.10311 Transcript_3934/m.10311 type:complete len:259 (+) Transcript_3934:106-882(+)|eukprot:CAMPEP_0197175514 /NCGR_PEP_ID=MMETSP1423-20130617/1711_1 /TAXON_ID=476441 /ORGANISM="Pseudo-nitzschia heimii, Strain UNC1101" /LENGTH=258 /DNA_ID=CAMNT_0042624691 /DNA_START=93 /DNA_END=869 /DNA_ORIENTATION=+
MVYMNFIRRTPSRLLLIPGCQNPWLSVLASARATKATLPPIAISDTASAPDSIDRFVGLRSIASAATNTTSTSIVRESLEEPLSSLRDPSIATRSKHSSTQIKRFFKKNPAKRRIAAREEKDSEDISSEDSGIIPKSTIKPSVIDAKILNNGWNVPVDDGQSQELPFRIARTKNKPNNAVGFLPVYAEYRKDGARVTTRIKKVSGDRGLFLNELRAVLRIPVPKNPRDDEIRIRNGGTLEIKGNRVLEVKRWLASLGF